LNIVSQKWNIGMDKLLREIPLFMEVARQKGFTKAADVLNIPLSTVSRRISELEKDLGIPLFFRNSRKVELTESGKLFFRHCGTILTEANVALDALKNNLERPTGSIRLVLPSEVYHEFLKGKLGYFAAKWPCIDLHIYISNRWVDLHFDEFDLNIRSGSLPDSDLKVRKLFTLQPALYASKKLFLTYRLPAIPTDIAMFPCIVRFQDGNDWVFHNYSHRETVPIQSRYLVDSNSVALDLALAGVGVAWLIPAQVQQYEISGELIRLLPEWKHASVDLSVVMANTLFPQRIRLFVDYLVECFSSLPQ
jgi:DNA-binding transcriptional LysR family regulator